MKTKHSISDWAAWFFYAFVLALGVHPIRRFVFADLYKEMNSTQELVMFLIIVFVFAIFVVRPFSIATKRIKNGDKE